MKIKILLLLTVFALPVQALAQHDPGRNSVRLLGKGQMDDAVNLVSRDPSKNNSPISEADRCFVLAMAACQQGDVVKAFDYAKEAVDQGLPVSRLQAGPRDVLEPLYAHAEYKQWISAIQKHLVHGPMLCSLTDTTASFWVRTSEEMDVRVSVKTIANGLAEAVSSVARARTSSSDDFTATVMVSGLSPTTRYRYRVLIGEKVCATAEFCTPSKQHAPSHFSIAFGGGAGFTPQHEYMWATMKNLDLGALLLLGDNVYVDDPEHMMTHHYCYYRRQSQPEWRSLVASTSVYSIYDDHDFGTNDCVPGPEIETPAWKRPVWEVFTQNWNNPAYGGGVEQPGCWYDFYIGDVHFIMCDGRYYRDLKGGSMLGSVQKAWLLDTLKSSKGRFKVLASPVPWAPGVKPGSKDTWDGFPDEREEIFSFIEKQRIAGVVLMSADRHRSDLRKIARPNGYDFYEVMSSRLTNVHTHGLVEKAKGSEFIMGYNKKCSFGLLDFDTTVVDPQVTYTMIDIDNEDQGSYTIKLSDLSFSDSISD